MKQVSVKGNVSEAAFDVPPEHIVRSSKGKGWNGIDIAEIVHPLDDFACLLRQPDPCLLLLMQ